MITMLPCKKHSPHATYACTRSANTASTAITQGCRTRLGIITWCTAARCHTYQATDIQPITAARAHLSLNAAHVLQSDKFQRLVLARFIIATAVTTCGPAFQPTVDDRVRASIYGLDDLCANTKTDMNHVHLEHAECHQTKRVAPRNPEVHCNHDTLMSDFPYPYECVPTTPANNKHAHQDCAEPAVRTIEAAPEVSPRLRRQVRKPTLCFVGFKQAGTHAPISAQPLQLKPIHHGVPTRLHAHEELHFRKSSAAMGIHRIEHVLQLGFGDTVRSSRSRFLLLCP